MPSSFKTTLWTAWKLCSGLLVVHITCEWLINHSALMVFHVIRTQKKNNLQYRCKSQFLPFLTLHFNLWTLCMSIQWKHTSWPAGRVCSIHRTESVPFFFLVAFKCSSLGICYVRWFLQWFFPDLNGFWFKIYEHWLTVTLLMRCNFVSAFQKLRVNKTNEIMYMSFCQTWYNKLIWPNNL